MRNQALLYTLSRLSREDLLLFGFVPRGRLELPWFYPLAPKASASAIPPPRQIAYHLFKPITAKKQPYLQKAKEP